MDVRLLKLWGTHESAEEDDFFPDAELLLVYTDVRCKLDPDKPLECQGKLMRVESVSERGTVYYRYLPDGKERCFVPLENFFRGGLTVLKKISRETVQLRIVA